MEKIIAEIAKKFIKNLSKIFEGEERNFSNIEERAFEEAKSCAAEMIGAYTEVLDRAILADKRSRREAGYALERQGDTRRIHTLLGEVAYRRSYYKKASGGYEYLVDTIIGVESRSRVSDNLCLSLTKAGCEMSYQKAAKYLTKGLVSRQTVMHSIRKNESKNEIENEKRKVSELHIDADEAHVTLCGGRKSEVPLVSYYEGIEKKGKRHYCKNIRHISEYGKSTDDLWEQVLTEIESRYDLNETQIYLHGDGASWIQKGLEWFPDAIFVLDKYHKNKAIKDMIAGLEKPYKKLFDKNIREALDIEDLEFFGQMTMSLCNEQPDRAEKILKSGNYLKKFVSGISVCVTDPSANNGGCTEPHVSHVLSQRLSSRPMAWSKSTLKKLAPMLADGEIIALRKSHICELPAPLRKSAASASKAFRRGCAGLPHPDSIGNLPLVSGKVISIQKYLNHIC